jgi:hypothetical protein
MKARVRCVFYLLLRLARVQIRAIAVRCAIVGLCVGLFMESFYYVLRLRFIALFLIIGYFELCSLQVKARLF